MFEPSSPPQIGSAFVMLTTIRFDDQLMFGAREIDDKGTDRMLTAKSVSLQTTMAQSRDQARNRPWFPNIFSGRKVVS